MCVGCVCVCAKETEKERQGGKVRVLCSELFGEDPPGDCLHSAVHDFAETWLSWLMDRNVSGVNPGQWFWISVLFYTPLTSGKLSVVLFSHSCFFPLTL